MTRRPTSLPPRVIEIPPEPSPWRPLEIDAARALGSIASLERRGMLVELDGVLTWTAEAEALAHSAAIEGKVIRPAGLPPPVPPCLRS